MIVFAYPWVFLAAPIALLVHWLCPPLRQERPSLHVPFLARLCKLTGQRPGQGSSVARGTWGRKATLLLVWFCALGAAARPQWIEPPVSKTWPMRDLLVAVDLSGSMDTRDFTDASGKTVDRLTAVKQVLDSFLASRQGDRVGLVFFGTAAFVQAPFTEDLGICRRLLAEAQTKMAGPQTAFGDAIGLAVNLFARSPVQKKVLIVLTDGNDTASQVPPVKAAEIAKSKGIVIHTVSVGDPRSAGEEALDMPTLQAVARTTGGISSAASDRQQLEQIYQSLSTLEAPAAQTISHRPRRDVSHWPLATGFLLSLLYHAAGVIGRARQHSRPAIHSFWERRAAA